MKKSELKTQIAGILESNVNEETLNEVLSLIDQLGRRASTPARPKEIEVDGQTYRWCNRHGQYEPIEWFLIENNGNYKPECAPAYYRWQAYGKEINAAIKEGDAVKLGELTLLRKKGGYDLKKDAKEFADKLAEAGISIDVKNVIKEEDVEK